jgi:hypothetical protein
MLETQFEEMAKRNEEQEQWIEAAKEAANGGSGLIVRVVVCKRCGNWNT